MNRKVLFIDPVCFSSHINFNKLQITALSRLYDVEYIFKKGYYENFGLKRESIIWEIPTTRNYMGGIRFRMYLLLIFSIIKYKIRLKQYDKIIISYYDEIALYFSYFPTSYLFNHANVGGLHNKIKLWFFKKLSKRHTHIVMDYPSLEYLKKNNIKNIKVIRHGIIDSYARMPRPKILNKYNLVIFSPSAVSSDENLLGEIITDKRCLDWLENHNVGLVIRTRCLKSISENILILDKYLTDEEYRTLFTSSDAILITYPETYKYRTSGVLLEALACSKKVILSDTECMRQYEEIYGNNVYFDNTQSFINAIANLEMHKFEDFKLSKYQLQKLMPDYTNL